MLKLVSTGNRKMSDEMNLLPIQYKMLIVNIIRTARFRQCHSSVNVYLQIKKNK